MAPGPLPEELRFVQPYLQRAKETEKHDTVVPYYCKFYAVKQALGKPGTRSPEVQKWIMAMMDDLEESKKKITQKDALTSDDVGYAYVESFALRIFNKVDADDRAGRATKETAVGFLSAAQIFDVLKVFKGIEPDPDVAQKTKYAKWKAAEIIKALKEGRRPDPGPPGWSPDQDAMEQQPPMQGNNETDFFDSAPSQPQVMGSGFASPGNIPHFNNDMRHTFTDDGSHLQQQGGVGGYNPTLQEFGRPNEMAPMQGYNPAAGWPQQQFQQPSQGYSHGISSDQAFHQQQNFHPSYPPNISDPAPSGNWSSNGHSSQDLIGFNQPYTSTPSAPSQPFNAAPAASFPAQQPQLPHRPPASSSSSSPGKPSGGLGQAPPQSSAVNSATSSISSLSLGGLGGGKRADAKNLEQAERHIRHALSAVQFEDVPTALACLAKAQSVLSGCL